MTRASPALLRLAAASNAARNPLPPHHGQVYATLAYGAGVLSRGDLWVLDSLLRLSSLSESQQANLNAISVAVELGR